MGEVILPAGAEIDMPSPETAQNRLGILVVMCAKLAGLAGVLCIFHNVSMPTG